MKLLQFNSLYILYILLIFSFVVHSLNIKVVHSDTLDLILHFIFFIVDFKICGAFYRWLKLVKQSSDKNRIYIYPFNKKEPKSIFYNVHVVIIFMLLVIYIFLLRKNVLQDIFYMIVFFFLLIIDRVFNLPDKNDILEAKSLHIGYGAALAYYKNYFCLNMPHKFKKRIEYFKTFNKVNLKTKLYILVPFSCQIPCYLDDDDEEENIERCQELPEEKIDHGGTKERVYNVTVYLVRSDQNDKGVRMAVEFAQPLKGLFSFKQNGLISEMEMHEQRKLFTKILKQLLKDDKEINELCEVIEYDDGKRKVYDVLSESYYSNSLGTV